MSDVEIQVIMRKKLIYQLLNKNNKKKPTGSTVTYGNEYQKKH